MVLGWKVKRWIWRLEWGDEMIAIFWFTRLFGWNNTKYLLSGNFAGPLLTTALLQICHKEAPHLLRLEYQWPRNGRPTYAFLRPTYTFGWRIDTPEKAFGFKFAVDRIRGFLTFRQLNFPDNWITNVTVTHTFRNRTHSISSHFCIWINVMNMIWKMIKQPGSGIGGQTWHNTKGLAQGEYRRDGRGGGPLNGSTQHTCGSVLSKFLPNVILS